MNRLTVWNWLCESLDSGKEKSLFGILMMSLKVPVVDLDSLR